MPLPMQLPCNFGGCEEKAVGKCHVCDHFFCTEHLHYQGRDPDTNDVKTICLADLEKSRLEHILVRQPVDITFAHLVNLHSAVESYVKILVEDDYGREDAKQYIFEAAVELFCGEKCWNKLNKLAK